MAINLNGSRRTTHIRCKYWKRDESNLNDNETFVYDKEPDGVFYAKELNSKQQESKVIAGVFKAYTQSTMIKTEDYVDIKNEDIIKYGNELWLVVDSNSLTENKMTEFGKRNIIRETTIQMTRAKE